MKIIDYGLPLPIQRLYIKRLKHMIQRWEFENFCGHCPVNKRFKEQNESIKKLRPYHRWGSQMCNFCKGNVNVAHGCPCDSLRPKKALKRAKDFIERFEAEEGGKGESN